MRFFSVLSAILVCVALFFVVLQREALFRFAAELTGDAPDTEPAAVVAPEEPVAIVAAGEVRAVEAVHVSAIHSRASDVPDAVLVRGQTEAARQVVVMAETSGGVTSAPLRKGAFVAAGDLLCELDPGTRAASLAEAEAGLDEARARRPEAQARVPEAEARVAEAEARLQEAMLNQTAARRLAEGGFAADTRVLSADAALRAAEAGVTAATSGVETTRAGIQATQAGIEAAAAAVERARLDIDKLTIEAPFAGLLETDTAELGSLLQPGTPCATIVQLDPMKLVGFLPEAQVDRVSVDAGARARLASGRSAAGLVTFLSRSADRLTRTFRVEVTVPNPNLEIRDGQTAEILIQTPATNAHLIPASALTLNDDGQLGVRVIEPGEDGDRAGFAAVELVRDTVDGVLLAGLPDAVDVIVVGQEYVTTGTPVRATYGDAASVPPSTGLDVRALIGAPTSPAADIVSGDGS